MAELQAPRGMSDLLPEEAALWRYVRDTAEKIAGLFDYHLISTPIVEDARVFARTVGDESDIISKEMYVFEDRGGGTLALRPEGTAAVCRAYLEYGMASRPQPIRLYYFGPMFRYDRPQAGRYRQLWQFGAECIGDASPAADAEVIELQHMLFSALGLDDLVLRINSIGTAETRHAYAQILKRHFEPHLGELSQDSQRRFETNVLRILDSKEDSEYQVVKDAPSILDYLSDEDTEHFGAVRTFLDTAGIPYEIDHRIVRGLDYYARTVWEFQAPGGNAQSTAGAGGRYDGLIELLGGPATPGTGFATGIERTLLNMHERQINPPTGHTVDVITIPLGDTGAIAAIQLAQLLRAEGLVVRAGTTNRSLRAQLRSASTAGARFAAIIGDAEAAHGIVQLKPLDNNGEQVALSMSEVPKAVLG